MSTEEEYLIDRVRQLEELLIDRSKKLEDARSTIGLLERVVHAGALIAVHLPAMCASLPEVSAEMEQASLQLSRILVHRDV